MKKETQTLGFWERFYLVFSPKFLSKLLQTKSMSGKSWGFWFLSNTFLTLILLISIFFVANYFVPQIPQKIESALANETVVLSPNEAPVNALELVKNAQLTLKNGELSTSGFPDPFIFAGAGEVMKVVTAENLELINNSEYLFVLDTTNVTGITEADIRNKVGGVLVTNKAATVWENDKNKLQTIDFSEFSQDEEAMVLNWEKISNITADGEFRSGLNAALFVLIFIIGFFVWIFLAVLRLLNVLLWTLLWWPIGSALKLKNWGFEKTFETLMHFGFITVLLAPIGIVIGSSFWWTLLILICLFGMNFWQQRLK